MNLVQKGERNLELARILDSDEFRNLSGFQKEHLCSIIINRLYYGVYLIAKGKLVEKGICTSNDDIPHSGQNGVWKRLENENCFNGIKFAHQLRNMRNCADYQEDNTDNAKKNIAKAKSIAHRLSQTLEEIK